MATKPRFCITREASHRFPKVLPAAVGLLAMTALAQTAGSPSAPVRYIGNEIVSPEHDGGLRLAVGAKNYQIFRANRAHPTEGVPGWTYNHAPMLTYWKNKFYLEYLSDPVSESVAPGHSLLMTFSDGEHWESPRVVFPVYESPDHAKVLMHQRMGFYIAPNGRLLILGFYGFQPAPNNGTGIGRVVREVKEDGSFGPVYFIRYNSHNGFGPSNTSFPFWQTSKDEAFKSACAALLADRLITMQWWEEDRATDGFYYPMDRVLKAFSFFHRPDGAVVGLWKSSWTSLSSDEGKTWSPPVEASSLAMAEAKVWGQQTSDGHYALVYNPRRDNRHRWPLAAITGSDGIHFDNMVTIHGEVPLPRYSGKEKDFGPQYVRGIESYRKPPLKDLWLTYSMNKEDLWVSRVPVPIRSSVEGPVFDDFNHGATSELDWNLYSPMWAPVRIADVPSASNRSLELEDRDPADYARAIRTFPVSKSVAVSFKLMAKQNDTGRLEIELLDHAGYRPPVRLFLDDQGQMTTWTLDQGTPVLVCRYQPNHWYSIGIRADRKSFDLTVDGRLVLQNAEVLERVDPLERISFRTGAYRQAPTLRDPMWPLADMPGADVPSRPAFFYVDDFKAGPQDSPGQ